MPSSVYLSLFTYLSLVTHLFSLPGLVWTGVGRCGKVRRCVTYLPVVQLSLRGRVAMPGNPVTYLGYLPACLPAHPACPPPCLPSLRCACPPVRPPHSLLTCISVSLFICYLCFFFSVSFYFLSYSTSLSLSLSSGLSICLSKLSLDVNCSSLMRKKNSSIVKKGKKKKLR